MWLSLIFTSVRRICNKISTEVKRIFNRYYIDCFNYKMQFETASKQLIDNVPVKLIGSIIFILVIMILINIFLKRLDKYFWCLYLTILLIILDHWLPMLISLICRTAIKRGDNKIGAWFFLMLKYQLYAFS